MFNISVLRNYFKTNLCLEYENNIYIQEKYKNYRVMFKLVKIYGDA